MFHALPKPFLYSAYRLFAEFDKSGEKKTAQGTAFFVTDGKSRIGLVTNRHAIDLAYKDSKYVGFQLSGLAIRGYFEKGSFAHAAINLSNAKIVMAATYSEDVATVRLGQIQVHDSSVVGTFTPYAVRWEMLATKVDFDGALDICDMVAFPGYPPWFDRDGQRPIIRCGTIASDPISNYSWKDGQPVGRRLAYEAFSFGGSSGSPVFALEKGIKLASPQSVVQVEC